MIMEVVHVATGLLHEHALDELAVRDAVALASCGHRAQPLEGLLELVNEELLRVAMLPPPVVLGCEPPPGLIEQDDSHPATGLGVLERAIQ